MLAGVDAGELAPAARVEALDRITAADVAATQTESAAGVMAVTGPAAMTEVPRRRLRASKLTTWSG